MAKKSRFGVDRRSTSAAPFFSSNLTRKPAIYPSSRSIFANYQPSTLATDTDPQQHNYQFTNDEYFKLLNAAQTAAPLWHEVINRNGQALELLNSTLFTSPKPTELQQILEQQLNRCETLTRTRLGNT